MVENAPLQEDVKHWKAIELFLVQKHCANAYEIAKHLEIHWVTAQKELQQLEDMGRIHREGTTYFLNGIGQWQKRVDLSDSHTLFIDTFRTPFGKNFVRIKETKKQDDDWVTIGNIMITKEKIGQVKDFLSKVEENLNSLT